MNRARAPVNVAAMFRLLGFLVFVLGLFGSGFYAGIRYYEHEIVQNPSRFVKLYQDEFTDTAKEKINELKKIIRGQDK